MSLAASDQTGKSGGGDGRRVSDEVREAFVARVKAIDPVFKRGDLEPFWAMRSPRRGWLERPIPGKSIVRTSIPLRPAAYPTTDCRYSRERRSTTSRG